MIELTPETLMNAHRVIMGDACLKCGGTDWVCAEEVDAHIPIWAADRKRVDELLIELIIQANRSLRRKARIEALERALQFYADGNTDMDATTGKYGVCARDALAAKETRGPPG